MSFLFSFINTIKIWDGNYISLRNMKFLFCLRCFVLRSVAFTWPQSPNFKIDQVKSGNRTDEEISKHCL